MLFLLGIEGVQLVALVILLFAHGEVFLSLSEDVVSEVVVSELCSCLEEVLRECLELGGSDLAHIQSDLYTIILLYSNGMHMTSHKKTLRSPQASLTNFTLENMRSQPNWVDQMQTTGRKEKKGSGSSSFASAMKALQEKYSELESAYDQLV